MNKCIDDYVGQQHGTRTIIGVKRNGSTSLIARCECGVIASVNMRILRTRGMPECMQCWMRRMRDTANINGQRHNGKRTKLYTCWRHMHERCKSQKAFAWERYGGRGIAVCQQWQEFAVFRDWAYENGYAEGLQIDRIDNDGHYEPVNCQWVSPSQNCNKRRTSHFITAWGETKTLAQWTCDPRCRAKGPTIRYRLRNGVPPETAISAVPITA